MARNLGLEKEMKEICKEIWARIGVGIFPEIESKEGGASGCYYEDRHKVYFRWNVWHKLNITGKRLLAIHELIHATGWDHKSLYGYMHGSDILSLEIYKIIYGEPDISVIKEMAKKLILK